MVLQLVPYVARRKARQGWQDMRRTSSLLAAEIPAAGVRSSHNGLTRGSVKTQQHGVAAVLLKQQKAHARRIKAKDAKTSADQFLRAVEMPPRRYKFRLQRSLYAGPTARKDAEEKERARWVEVLGSMLVHTPTPMGRILGDNPGSLQLLGAGRRASTSRSRLRAVRRYSNWLALNHDVGCPCELDHVTGYSLARQSEPCTRNALRAAHTAIALMGEVAGVEQSRNFTGAQVYAIIQKEILADTLPCRPSNQAPKDAGWDYVNARESGHVCAILSLPPYLRVVDSSTVMGDIEIRRPPWHQARRRFISWRFLVGSVDAFKNSRLRSSGGISPNIH